MYVLIMLAILMFVGNVFRVFDLLFKLFIYGFVGIAAGVVQVLVHWCCVVCVMLSFIHSCFERVYGTV